MSVTTAVAVTTIGVSLIVSALVAYIVGVTGSTTGVPEILRAFADLLAALTGRDPRG